MVAAVGPGLSWWVCCQSNFKILRRCVCARARSPHIRTHCTFRDAVHSGLQSTRPSTLYNKGLMSTVLSFSLSLSDSPPLSFSFPVSRFLSVSISLSLSVSLSLSLFCSLRLPPPPLSLSPSLCVSLSPSEGCTRLSEIGFSRFRVLGSGFWVLVFGFWVLGSGFWGLGSGLWFSVPGSGFRFLVSGFWVLGSGFCFLVSGFWVQKEKNAMGTDSNLKDSFHPRLELKTIRLLVLRSPN